MPGRCLRRLAQVLPTFGVLQLLVGNHPAMLRKAESMLAMLLEVTARRRRHSELVPALGPRPKPTATYAAQGVSRSCTSVRPRSTQQTPTGDNR